MVQIGDIMKGGTIVDATIINAPSSTKNADKACDLEMHQTKKENSVLRGDEEPKSALCYVPLAQMCIPLPSQGENFLQPDIGADK